MSPSRELPGSLPSAQLRECILVVEDEFLIRLMLAEELRGVGYQVIEACDATEALAFLETVTPDLVITDVRMPGPFDGMGLLARIRETESEMPVIMISGHLHPSQALMQGATQFIAKPYLLDAVVAAVRKALGQTP